VLSRAGLVALGTVVIKTRQYVCSIAPLGRTLMLDTLRYADEVLPHEEFGVTTKGKTAQVSRQELQMAMQLVEQMRQPFKPQSFRDTYRDDLMKRIDQKIRAGETHELTEPTKEAEQRPTAKVVDLTALLRKSLEASRHGAAPESRATAGAKRSRSRAVRRRSGAGSQRSRA
jgi:DNA end-binding protein Ku